MRAGLSIHPQNKPVCFRYGVRCDFHEWMYASICKEPKISIVKIVMRSESTNACIYILVADVSMHHACTGWFLCEFSQNHLLLNRRRSRQMFIMHNPNAQTQTHVFDGRVCGLPCVPQMLDPSNPEQCCKAFQVWPFSVNGCFANPPQQMLRSHIDSSNLLTLSLGFPTNGGTGIYSCIITPEDFFVESGVWHSVRLPHMVIVLKNHTTRTSRLA